MRSFFEQQQQQQQQSGSSGGRQDSKTDTTRFYKVLGIAKDATDSQIKKAFRKLAREHHPDRGGDPEKFKEVQTAYEILGNAEKRALYDKYGMEGVEKGGPPSSGGFYDLFNPQKSGKKKGQGGKLGLEVTLSDLYNGCTKKASFTKQFFCEVCGGTGGKNVQVCPDCKGVGTIVKSRPFGHNIIQQMHIPCSTCNRTGEIMKAKDRCRGCQGRKVIKKTHEFDVPINKGMRDKEKILFREMGDQAPGIIPGDVYVELKLKKNRYFRREGAHLHYDKEITLVEALTGFEFTVTTLDKRTLIVQSQPNVIYTSGAIRAIREEGMPLANNCSVYGNLYINIKVKWPKTLDIGTIKEIGTILPTILQKQEIYSGDDIEEVTLEDVNITTEREKWAEEKRARQAHKSQLDEDYEEERGGIQQAQCQTQ